jgi:hypothetical protein
MRVVRIIQYEGPKGLVDKQLARSMPYGSRDCGNGVLITVRGYSGLWDFIKFLVTGRA